MPHKENGLIDRDSDWAGDNTEADLSDVQGKYTQVRDLLIVTYDGTSVAGVADVEQ